jgi:hypothetical protein
MSKIKKLFKKYKLDYLSLTIIMTSYYGYIQWNAFIGDPDGFYHAKLAKWLTEGRLIESLPWMQFSSLKDSFTDHHLLYHLILAPFTVIFDPLIGVKIATVLFAVAMVLTFYWLLKKMYIPWAWYFSLAFLLLSGLNFRISLIKANSLSILMIWLIIYALFEQKKWLALILGWLFVWLYGGWPLAILILGAYIASQKIYQKIHTHKLKLFWHQTLHLFKPHKKPQPILKISLYLLSGLALGLILSPYWPQNLYFYYQQFLQIGVVNMGSQFIVGSEWYGTSITQIISSAPHIFVAAFISFIILFFKIKKVSKLTWFSFLMTFIFLVLTIKSRRYVEYYMPFSLLYLASAVKDINAFTNWSKIKKIWRGLSRQIHVYLYASIFVLLVLILPFAYDRILGVQLSGRHPMDSFQEASQWLINNTEPDSIVFHSDWDEWPILFYQNDHNRYIIGLDPTFMENYDSELHTLYREITTGNIRYKVSKYIKEDFKASYVFVDKDGHESLIRNLDIDPEILEVYEDQKTIIYQLR